MCQCRFNNCNKRTAVVGDIKNGSCAGVGSGSGRILYAFTQFFCELKTAPKSKVYSFKANNTLFKKKQDY